MTNRRALLALIGALVAAPLAAVAQQADKVYRIGYLRGGSATVLPENDEAFRQGLRELGWIEGQNIVVQYRFAEGRLDRLPALAAELVRLKVDVIVAGPAPPAVAAKNATATIPIVMLSVGDPVGLGLVASLAHPGGNVTGLAYSVGLETVGKQLQLLKEVVPNVRRVAILSNPANPSHALAIREARVTARSLGVELQLLEARDPVEIDRAFSAMVKEHAGALFVVTDAVFNEHRARVIELAARNHLPAIYGLRLNVEAGGLMSYAPSLPDHYRRAATFVDKILKGAKPADLPVEQPTKFDLVINLLTAKALGIKIPQSLLARADEVIQ